jgi:hypothetical protein
MFLGKSLVGGDLDLCLLDTILPYNIKVLLGGNEETSFSVSRFFGLSSGLSPQNKACFGVASKNFLKWIQRHLLAL